MHPQVHHENQSAMCLLKDKESLSISEGPDWRQSSVQKESTNISFQTFSLHSCVAAVCSYSAYLLLFLEFQELPTVRGKMMWQIQELSIRNWCSGSLPSLLNKCDGCDGHPDKMRCGFLVRSTAPPRWWPGSSSITWHAAVGIANI